MERKETAFSAFEVIINAKALLKAANAYFNEGHYDLAVTYLNRAIGAIHILRGVPSLNYEEQTHLDEIGQAIANLQITLQNKGIHL